MSFSSNTDSPSPPDLFAQLIPPLQQAVEKSGYTKATPIQSRAVPDILDGRDVVGIAQTGTGKTAAFVLPILQRLAAEGDKTRPDPRVLIMTPTRELTRQIIDSLENYGSFLPFKSLGIHGGVSQGPQVQALKRGVDVLVATPGRLLDLITQNLVNLDAVRTFVLDEMDQMLDFGFIRDIRKIAGHLPGKRQTLFFSATLSPRIQQLAGEWVRNPVEIRIDPDQPAVERISQNLVFLEEVDKPAALIEQLRAHPLERTLIFVQMKHSADRLVRKLRAAGLKAEPIHGNKSQSFRTRTLDAFKQGDLPVLVATDVAARGLDIDNVGLIINYDLPVDSETYVHRIGRTARAGSDGSALSFCSPRDRQYLRDIEALLGKPVPADLAHSMHSESARHSTEKPRVPGGKRPGGQASKNRTRTPPRKRRGRR